MSTKDSKTEQPCTLHSVSGSYWFDNILSRYQRDKVREHYNLKERTLKITDEMLNDIYKEELNKEPYLRLFDSRWYNYR